MANADARDGVRIAIQKSGFKKKFIAENSGLTEQQLCDIIKKRRKLEANEMLAVCTVIGITPNELFGINVTKSYST